MKEFLDYVRHKRIVIVGNAESLFGQGLGAEIDAYDVVVRINAGVIIDPEQQGSRTDIWSHGFGRPWFDKYYPNFINVKFVLSLLHAHTHKNFIPKLENNVSCDRGFYEKIKLALDTEAVSTGLVTTEFFKTETESAEIAIAGFDFYKTKTWYRDSKASIHEWDKEKKYMLETLCPKLL